jgi:S-DNA-T family DNA segregation ATPase FtsK/SpoIIIE
MTFSLGTLRSSASSEPTAPSTPRVVPRWRLQLGVVFGGLLWLLWLIALVSHDPADAAFSTSGGGGLAHNLVGLFGAWLSDLSYVMLGLSVWWAVLLTARSWLALCARWLRADLASQGPAADLPQRRPRWMVPIGVLVLLGASTALEWTRLYRFEGVLAGSHSGGVLGAALGPLSMKLLGFVGSGLFWIVMLVLGLSWAFDFSWLQLAERLGAGVDRLRDRLRHRREQAEDQRIGVRAQRERARDQAPDERSDVDGHAPFMIEPTLGDLPPLSPAPVANRLTRFRPEPWLDEPPPDQVPTLSDPLPTLSDEIPTLTATVVPVAPPPEPKVATRPVRPVAVQNVAPKVAVAEPPPPHQPHLPQVHLLDAAGVHAETTTPASLDMTSRLIEKKLKDFGVEVKVVAAQPGPVITRYEIEPATGVKGSQIVGLAKDLARSLSLVSIRVVETIPGKNCMALELPNARRQIIRLSEVLGSNVYSDASSLLTMGLGKDIVGKPMVADLAKMPHCLVAGTTGSGKSVGINAMILSLLYKADADQVRLILIDPKMLELSIYEGIPHLLAPVVTDMKQASNALTWCVAEMERRYKLMSKLGVRNLAGYNKKIADAAVHGELLPNPFSLTPEAPEPLDRLPHIVVVIDELADLMMVVGKKIEELIARLAQKARAAGIHLILATQRPSVDVITGLIKANIPTRLSFQVSSKIDSRTILDQMGAEALLGQGDMLYLAPGTGLPIRVHGAFVSDDEVHRVVEYLKSQGEPNYIEGILEGGVLDANGNDSNAEGYGASGDTESDPMYDQAVAVVLQHRKASISLVQRHLRIGYNRAARLLEQMEKSGLVSSMSGSGNRDLLVPVREAE